MWVPAGRERQRKRGDLDHASEGEKVTRHGEISGGVAMGHFYRQEVRNISKLKADLIWG